MIEQAMAVYRELEARGWPRYDVDPERCMACAAEFLDWWRGGLK